MRVENDALAERYLVGAGSAHRLPGAPGDRGGTIDANGVVRLLRPPPDGTSYTVSAVIADPTPAELRHPPNDGRALPTDPLDAAPFTGEPAVPAFGNRRLARRRSRRCSRIGRPGVRRTPGPNA